MDPVLYFHMRGVDHVTAHILSLAGPGAVAAAYDVSKEWRGAVERTLGGPT